MSPPPVPPDPLGPTPEPGPPPPEPTPVPGEPRPVPPGEPIPDRPAGLADPRRLTPGPAE